MRGVVKEQLQQSGNRRLNLSFRDPGSFANRSLEIYSSFITLGRSAAGRPRQALGVSSRADVL